MINQIIAEAAATVATAAVVVPMYFGFKGLVREDNTQQCQTIGEYLSQAARGIKPDYARIRTEQTRRRILG